MSEDLRFVRYSVIVPLWNERESITPLYGRLKETLDATGHTFECVFVDDGSTDGSFPLLQEIAQVDSRVTVVALRHNAGKSVALGAGFNAARGDFVGSQFSQHSSEAPHRALQPERAANARECGTAQSTVARRQGPRRTGSGTVPPHSRISVRQAKRSTGLPTPC